MRLIKDLSGPKGLPIIGNLHQLDRGRFHKSLEDLATKYGSCYKLKMGSRTAIVFSNYDAIVDVLKRRPEDFRRSFPLEDIVKEIGIVGLFHSEGDEWRRQRNAWTDALKRQNIKSFESNLALVSNRLKNRLARLSKTNSKINLPAELKLFAVDITILFVFGTDVNSIENEATQLVEDLSLVFKMVNKRMSSPFPIWRLYEGKDDKRLNAAMARIRAVAIDLVEDARLKYERSHEKPPSNLIELLVTASKGDGTKFSNNEVIGNAMVALLAGEDTTANSISWATFLLLSNSVEKDKLANISTEWVRRGKNWDLLEEQDRQYVDAIINESFRMKPVVPFMALATTKETSVEDVKLPAETNVFVLNRFAGIKTDYYHQPQSFKPSRWLGGNKKVAQKAIKSPPMPFGGGARLCPGRNLALMEIRFIMLMLFSSFKIDLSNKEQVLERFAFTMEPENLEVSLEINKDVS